MIITADSDYNDEDTTCRGFIAYDDKQEKPMPGVIVAHDWGGRGMAACKKAKQLAMMGYVGFAIDMYGNAKLGRDNTERRALMTPLREDRERLATRINAGFNALASLPFVDKTRIAAIGYCFGGLCVLDLARSGADVKGVVSFHGLLTAPPHAPDEPLKSKVLVLHGYDDPLVKPDEVNQFALEMTAKKVDWQIHMYGLTAHSFTNPLANDDEMGLHYNEQADLRSWKSTVLFLEEVLG
ncbi:MAG: dienelactone hydrolase family protein [Legionella sp.]|nr:dienelactone hydrolase family protein [Legionella sp.]